MKQIDISIIVVNYNLAGHIEKLIDSIELYLKSINYEIIVVDNNSPERDIEILEKKYSHHKFLFLEKNFGFGTANNKGIEIAYGRYYLLLNPDTVLFDNSIIKMIEYADKKLDWGIIGPKVILFNGEVHESALKFPNIRYELYQMFNILSPIIKISKNIRHSLLKEKYYKTQFLFGSCLLIRKEVHQQINGFDEDYFLFSEETDYCFRTWKSTNFKVIYFPGSQIFHESGAATKKDLGKRLFESYNSRLIFIIKNYSFYYGFILRSIIISYFIEKLIFQFLFKREKYYKNKTFFTKIINNYMKKRPVLNER